MDDATISSVFASAAQTNRDRTALRYHDGSWRSVTYGELQARAERIARLLAGKGFVRGDRAALIAENRPEWYASYLAVVMLGGIAVPLDMQWGAGEVAQCIGDSAAKIVFHSSITAENVREALERFPAGGINFDAPGFACSVRPPDAPLSGRHASPEDVASLLYTSGTTGQPKGVMLTHRNICSDAAALLAAGLVGPEDNVLAVLPLHHTYPFMCTFIVPFFAGASVTLGPGLKGAEIISAVKENGVTVVVGVPRLYEMMRNGILARLRERSAVLEKAVRLCGALRRGTGINAGKALFRAVHRNFPVLKFFASGGARLDPPVMEDLEALGFTVLEGYGLTETSPVVAFNPARRRKPGSAGRPLPGVELAVREDGEIAVKGPMVMKGYYRNPEATAEVVRDGWFLTGDLGSLDDEGYLFITGRKKEVIVLSSGKNVYPEDVERAYLSLPLIKEICVVGSGGAGAEDAIQAIIVPDLDSARERSVGNIAEALDWEVNRVSARLPGYMRIKGYLLHPGPLPRTPLGKLRRFMVRDLLVNARSAARSGREEDGILMGEETGRRVAENIRRLLDEDRPVRASDTLELDLGFDSLKKVELVSSLEEAFSVSLPDAFIAEVQTVGEIVAKLQELRTGWGSPERGAVSWKGILGKEPPLSEVLKTGVSHGAAERALLFILYMLLKGIFRLLFRPRVEGLENIPEEGPFVITPNHTSYLDGFIFGLSVPFRVFRKLNFLGLQQFFTGGFTAWFARMSHVVPIDAETYLSKALQMSAYLLAQGRGLCVFPEGGRSFDGEVLPFKKGIGVLAVERGVPVVPAAIGGAFKALPRGSFLLRPTRITVRFGEALRPASGGPSRHEEEGDPYQAFADAVREEVIRLARGSIAKTPGAVVR
ncbi:MAG: AMP-binding protein [Thermodesulfovibrionales bacterium]